ncbi:acyl carrier protein, partial [Streptomyces huiliensis]|uniref:acyl carrier protein n=1 Tax=Streptomyces huiliensis TaxID=2876027 RepID=UPI001CC142E0
GLAVAWGAMEDVGYVARHGIGDVMRRVGFDALPAAEALTSLETLLGRGADVAVVTRTDWGAVRNNFATVRGPRFDDLCPASAGAGGGGGRAALLETLATAPQEEALDRVTAILTEILCEVLQTTADRVHADRRLDQLGLDSLMGAELLTGVNRRLGCTLPAVEVLDSTTVADLAGRCLRRLRRPAG